MVRYNNVISRLMSNIFFKMLLCIILLIFGALFVKFSSSMTSFARNNEKSNSNNQNVQGQYDDSNVNSEETICVNLNDNDNNISENELVKKYVVDSSFQEYQEIDSSDIEYVIASVYNKNDYSENWIKQFNKKIVFLQKVFPTGKYWNHMGLEPSNSKETNNIFSVTDIPCNHNKYGELYCNAHYGRSDEVYPYDATCSQCRGFASLLSDLVFGVDAPVRYFEDYDEVRIGDQARIDGDYHSVFIIDKTDEYVIVAECNSDLQTCKINWGSKILRKDMSGWYISRWSD